MGRICACSFHVLNFKFHEQSVVKLWVYWCKNKSFWQKFTCTVAGWTDDGELCKTSCEKSGKDYNWCYKFSGSWDRCTPEIDAPESTESSIEEEPIYEKKLLSIPNDAKSPFYSIPNNGANRRWGFDAGIKPRFMEQKVSFDIFISLFFIDLIALYWFSNKA